MIAAATVALGVALAFVLVGHWAGVPTLSGAGVVVAVGAAVAGVWIALDPRGGHRDGDR